jgi:hypothetical protein
VDADLLDLMPHRVTIHRYTGQNTNAEATFGDAYEVEVDGQMTTSIPCRVVKSTEAVAFRRLADPTGRNTVIKSTIYLGVALPEIQLRDRVTLPDGEKRQVQSATTEPDQTADYYTELIV